MAVKKKFPYKTAVVACNGCGRGQKAGAAGAAGAGTSGAAGVGVTGAAGVGAAGSCAWGCIGCGACENACPFGAITWNENGAAKVQQELCKGCGLCAKACPKGLIHLVTCADYVMVKCSNHDIGKAARDACDTSCIGCGVCERTCTADAIRIKEGCAVIDTKYCLSCGMCVVKCPRGAIVDRRGIVRKK